MDKQRNILLENWDTPFEMPPFDRLIPGDFIPAIKKEISEVRKEIEFIADNQADVTFENTIVRLEEAGKKLNIISSTLFNINSAETNSEIQAATQHASVLLTEFSNDITLNKSLFERVSAVHSSKEIKDSLDSEQLILLENKYREFRNGGAELEGEERDKFRKITERLSVLSVKFEENLLAETNSFELHLKDEADLAGLPDSAVEAASGEAGSRNKKGWVFTLHYPSYVPFMQHSERRELRKKMYLAYSSRCYNNSETSNKEIVKEIVNLRMQLAGLLGYTCYADFVLEDRMAGSRERVNSFLSEMYKSSRPYALRDFNNVSEYAAELGHKEEIEKWDWPYYAEKLKKQLFTFDDELLKPYFQLEKVEKAIFNLAGILYGIKFERNNTIPSYHHDTKVYEVLSEDDKHLAVLMVDYHPRKGKSGGAWMTSYREQYKLEGKDIRPIVSIVMNFSKPTSSKPSLLTHTELTTLLHEFGHALHGILSKCRYESLAGTSVKRDFVELPSQLMENWAFEKEWLNQWAIHFETGEKIPSELIDKIRESMIFNEGYACNRQLSFGMLDMAWHSITESFEGDINSFEKEAIAETELFRDIRGTNQSCAFGHLFSGGYAAGYYGYKWAEVLDADAFSIFKKNGIFNQEIADRFRRFILEKGGSENPMKLFSAFKGSEPEIDAFLERSGFTVPH